MLVQVKGNQPVLLAACADLANHCTPTQCDVQHDKGHGRVETRTVRTWDVPPRWFDDDWQALVRQVVCVTRTVERQTSRGNWKRTSETAWWISTTAMSAASCQAAIRGHWSVENQNHYVRDVILREDNNTTRHKPAILARLRSMALNCIRTTPKAGITIERQRNALNFERLRRCACGIDRN